MVRTMLKSALREIRQSMGRYLAILAIIALGVGFFAGLRMCKPSMMATGREYLTEYRLFDFQLMSTLGFTGEDVEAMAALEGVEAARGSVYTDFLTQVAENTEIVLTARSLTDGINLPELVGGRMPQAANECLGDARYFSEEDLGSEITVSPNNDQDTLDLLAYDSYTLVGLAYSPYYLNFERGTSTIGSGSVTAFLYLPEEAFDFEAYYEIYLALTDPAEPYSEEYDAQIEGIKAAVEQLTEERADLRYTTLLADANKEIADGEQELADGWEEYRTERADAEAELADAYQELTDGEAEYADGLADYEQGQRDYADGLVEYEDGVKELEDAQVELEDAKAELEDAQAELADAKAELEEGESSFEDLNNLWQNAQQLAASTGMGTPERLVATLKSGQSAQMNASVDQALKGQGSSLEEFLGGWSQAEESIGQELNEAYLEETKASLEQGRRDYESGLADYESGKAEYESGLADYEQGKAELVDAERELADARKELADAKQELEDARVELDDGWAEYADGKAEAEQEFADAEAELADGERELADAKAELADLEEPDTFVLTREENVGYLCFDNDTAIIAAISLVFPVFFFLVAALVCMTTMKRMVDEERTQIGVLKAMGYSSGQIIGKYLFYSGSAALVGSALGYALGSLGLPWVIWEIYGMMYGFAPLERVFDPGLAAVSFAAALLCSMGATWLSCRVELRKPAAELIRPKAPKAGRRVFLEYITPLWKRLSFLHKVSVRNVLRYRSRFIMMVLGIGGCTALLVTGFGIRDSVASIVDEQFREITLYDYSVGFTSGKTQEEAEAYLAEHGWEEGLLVHSGSVDVITDSAVKSAYLVVSSTGELDGYISLHSGETPIAYPGPGEVVINTGLAQNLGVSQGDRLQLKDGDLGLLDVTISQICDNYVENYVYVSPETYQQQAGLLPEFQTLYLNAHEGADPYEEGAALSDGEGISRVAVNEATREQVDNMLSRLDYVVIVVVLCAAALAFIVLYNLTNINITERIREIATIKVLGFYQKEVAAYVFREIVMLSVLGSLVGLLMGKALHTYVMMQVVVAGMYFPHQIFPMSYLAAFALTMAFTFIISAGMRPRLRRVDMAESLKSIE